MATPTYSGDCSPSTPPDPATDTTIPRKRPRLDDESDGDPRAPTTALPTTTYEPSSITTADNPLSDDDFNQLLAATATPPPYQTIDPMALAAIPSTNITSIQADGGNSSNAGAGGPVIPDFPLFDDVWLPQEHAVFADLASQPGSPCGTVLSAPDADVLAELNSDWNVVKEASSSVWQEMEAAQRSTAAPQRFPNDYVQQHQQRPQPPPQQPYQQHVRSHSQPPEDVGLPPHPNQNPHGGGVTFQRTSGHFIGRPKPVRHPYPRLSQHPLAARQQPQPRQQQQQQQRARPLARNAAPQMQGTRRLAGPTSAPVPPLRMPLLGRELGSPMRGAPVPAQPGTPAPEAVGRMVGPFGGGDGRIQTLPLHQQSQQRATGRAPNMSPPVVVGMFALLDRISRECDEVRVLVQRGPWMVEDETARRVEMQRAEQRSRNAEVTGLDESLAVLAGPGVELEAVPRSGRAVRELNNVETDGLLQAYGVPFMSDMFLPHKKEAYLRFVGASRALMHRVLDD